MTKGHIAVIDIGKTNAKLALVDVADFSEIAVITRPNTVMPGPPWPHFDVDGHWDFLLDGMARFHATHGIDAISITTHGACAALIDADGALAAPILDYEHTGPDTVAADYNALRPPFDETGSPRLSMGLNIGAQLYWQFQTGPTLKDRVAQIVTYPQYWGMRLTGVAACDVTSLGCHTDLWNPRKACFSTLVDRLGLSGKMAPVRRPDHVLGPITADIAKRTGMAADTPVMCGIHDSNASLLPHVLGNPAPFSVVSTGTWVIAMAVGGTAVELDPEQDTLINVNALGDPVPSARFMGGREYDLATGGQVAAPTPADVAAVLCDGIMLLPALEPGSGPFKGSLAHWEGGEPPQGSGQRSAAVAFYLALVTATCLSNIGHKGPIIVEGPFAANAVYQRMLACVTGCPVAASEGSTGTSQGAAMLVKSAAAQQPRTAPPPETDDAAQAMVRYAQTWRTLAGA